MHFLPDNEDVDLNNPSWLLYSQISEEEKKKIGEKKKGSGYIMSSLVVYVLNKI